MSENIFEHSQHTLVLARSSELKLSDRSIVFPGHGLESDLSSLNSNDYQQFLLFLEKRIHNYQKNIEEKNNYYKPIYFDELQVTSCDTKAIQGLNNYFSKEPNIYFKKLSLNIRAQDLQDATFFENLSALLKNASKTNLQSIDFICEEVDLAHDLFNQLIDFIKKNDDIRIDINLPKFLANTQDQKYIDAIISDRLAQKRIDVLDKTQGLPAKPIRTTKRQRPRVKKSQTTLNIDIEQEQQQEQQQERQLETSSYLQEQAVQNALEENYGEVYDCQRFIEAIDSGKLNTANGYLLTQQKARKIWLLWTSALTEAEANHKDKSILISKEACEELLRHRQKFAFGLDLNNLPPGFIYKKNDYNTGGIVHFSLENKKIEAPNVLAVQTNTLEDAKPLPQALFLKALATLDDHHPIKNLFEQLNTMPYDKEMYLLFKKYLPKLFLLEPAKIKDLFHLIFNSKNPKEAVIFLLNNTQDLHDVISARDKPAALYIKLEEIFNDVDGVEKWLKEYAEIKPTFSEHLLNKLCSDEERAQIERILALVPDLNLDALLQLYAQLGTKDIDKLENIILQDVELFKIHNNLVFSKISTYESILNVEYINAINAIKGFSPAQRVWWDKLFSEHSQAQTDVNIIELVNAFKKFTQELDAKKLVLPNTCNLSNIKSLPVALSRILTLLAHCKSEDRQLQLQESQNLDLSSHGMIIGLNPPKSYGFVVDAMNINLDTWRSGELLKPIDKFTEILTQPNRVVQRFFCFIAMKDKNARLSLSFYQNVHNKISNSGLSDDIKNRLYAIFAESSSGSVKVKNINEEEALIDIDSMIQMFIATPLPSITPSNTKEIARRILCETLQNLTILPSIKILNKLTKFIFSSLRGMGAITNRDRINIAKRDLNAYLVDYDSAVYKGLEFYNDVDYSNSNLFYEHLATIAQISVDFEVHPFIIQQIVSLISTFSLNATAISQLKEEVFDGITREQLRACTQALVLLPFIDKNVPKLGFDDLKLILQAVKDNHNKNIMEIFQELQFTDGRKLSAYFPKGLLSLNQGVTIEHRNQINKHFNDKQSIQIVDILQSFNQPGDSQFYEKIIQKLVQITGELSTVEKNIFIAKLTSTKGLYTDNANLSDEHYFVKILDSIIEKNCMQEFLAFISTAYSKENLSQRTYIYLQEILPRLKTQNFTLNPLELYPRATDIICNTRIEDFSQPNSVISAQEHVLDETIHKIKLARNVIDKSSLNLDYLFEIDASLVERSSFRQLYRTIAEIKEQKNRLSNDDFRKISSNPVIQVILLGYILGENFLDEAVQNKVREKLPNYPDLLINKDDIQGLLKNHDFLINLSNPQIIQDLSDENFLEDDAKLDRLLEALNKDLKGYINFKSQLQNLEKELEEEKADLHKYPNVVMTVFAKLDAFIKIYPNTKRQILNLYDNYLKSYNAEQDGKLLAYLDNVLNTLTNILGNVGDEKIILSLCTQFNNSTTEFNAKKLLQLLELVKENTHKVEILKIVTILLNNDNYDYDRIANLAKDMQTDNDFATKVKEIYESPPYPSLENLLAWKNKNTIDASYAEYKIKPSHREDNNGFNIDIAKSQLKKFEGFNLNQAEIEDFNNKIVEARDKTIEELVATFNTYKEGNSTAYAALVACAAELLYRSKGQDIKDASGNIIPGSSMEINTTQYLAILAMLKSGGKVISQIGTGEGKSRIMMITIACQYALGKTVDFVTSDAQLAVRDYLEYQAYFAVIKAKTAMIFANTDPSVYQSGSIHFCDPANLSLFRNNAKAMGRGDEVIEPDEKKRALVLDEADVTTFDVAGTRFNISRESDLSIQDMEWVYPLLVQYFAQDKIIVENQELSPIELYYADIDLSRESFLQFVSSKSTNRQISQLSAVSCEQIEQWQTSAITAKSLEFEKDFVIKPDCLIFTPKGPRLSSEAQLLLANRVAPNSKLSFGVHQCLCAALNFARQNIESVTEPKLKEVLENCENDFYIPSEKQIVYSSNSTDLLDYYNKGTITAVTGTAGSEMELKELKGLHNINHIKVPRDKDLKRIDKGVRLTKNLDAQIKVLIEQIKIARAKNQPILVVAEDERQSSLLFEELKKVFPQNIQYVHSQLSLEEETKCINKAGTAQQITVSTAMIGRGTDIKLQGRAKEKGLSVIVNYLPSTRDLEQIIGRSGRAGAPGNSLLLLNRQSLRASSSHDIRDFYRNAEVYIAREQAIIDRNKQCERLIKYSLGNFRRSFTYNFFDDIFKNVNNEDAKKILPIWAKFFDKADKAWNELWPQIQEKLKADDIDVQELKKILDAYKNQVQVLWNNLSVSMQNLDIKCLDNNFAHNKLIAVPNINLGDIQQLLIGFKLKEYNLSNYKPLERYEEGHDGRVVVYKNWRIPFIASLKGIANLLPFVNFENARKPFANTRAWLAGYGQIFPNLRASHNKWTIVGATAGCIIGASIGLALIATGVFAPVGLAILGISNFIISLLVGAAIGLVAGAAVGLGTGAVADAISLKLSKDEGRDKEHNQAPEQPEQPEQSEPPGLNW